MTLVDYAHLRNVSKLIVGATQVAGAWHRWRRPVGERIAKLSDDLDVTRIGVEARPLREDTSAARRASWTGWIGGGERPTPPRNYLGAAAIGVGVTVLAKLIEHGFDLTNLEMLYLLGVVFAAFRLGRGPGILLSFSASPRSTSSSCRRRCRSRCPTPSTC